MTDPISSAPLLKYRTTLSQEESLVSEDGLNTFRIYCPNPLCQCLILRERHARLVRRPTKFDIPQLPPNQIPSASAPAIQAGEGETDFFEVKDMMSFENIGFSKTVDQSVKFLSCADCDLGPLGYQEVGPDAYKGCFLHLDRVRYLIPHSTCGSK